MVGEKIGSSTSGNGSIEGPYSETRRRRDGMMPGLINEAKTRKPGAVSQKGS